MARTVTDAKLESRTARSKLVIRKKPFYRSLEPGRHIGYYKGAQGGVWLARLNDAGKYREQSLGTADDVRDANGSDVLSFAQAQDAARAWFVVYEIAKAKRNVPPTPTVRNVVESYIEARNMRERTRRQDKLVNSSAAYKLTVHVLEKTELADTRLSDLSVSDLREWRRSLPGTSASGQRITNDFKAALNHSAQGVLRLVIRDGLAALSGDGSGLTPGIAKMAENKILADDEVRQLLEAIKGLGDEDFYRMCFVLAATGARFAQVHRLKVRDVQLVRQRIMMPPSHKGRVGSQSRPPIPTPIGEDLIETLLPIIENRSPNEPLLERWRHIQIGPLEWKRDRRAAWRTASELSRPLRAAAKLADLPPTTSSYSFRHSSIVRGLREGLPVRLVAQLHDTSVHMIERNYTQFFADALEDVARRALVRLT